MPYNKTTLKKMKKDELIDLILKAQDKGSVEALFEEEDEEKSVSFKEFESLKIIKNRLKDVDGISVDQVKGYNRRVAGSPLIHEHLVMIEQLYQSNKKLREALVTTTGGLETSVSENKSLKTQISTMRSLGIREIKKLKREIELLKAEKKIIEEDKAMADDVIDKLDLKISKLRMQGK